MSSVEEVFKSKKNVSSFYATTITFATSTTSTHCSKRSGVLRVTHVSQRQGIWNDIWLLVVIVDRVKHVYPKKFSRQITKLISFVEDIRFFVKNGPVDT